MLGSGKEEKLAVGAEDEALVSGSGGEGSSGAAHRRLARGTEGVVDPRASFTLLRALVQS